MYFYIYYSIMTIHIIFISIYTYFFLILTKLDSEMTILVPYYGVGTYL